jgi:hypothetical protein
MGSGRECRKRYETIFRKQSVMPYIKDEDRIQFEDATDDIINTILAETSETSRAGMLNYCISRIIAELLSAEGTTYNRINTYIGVLECAKMELYRRVAADYEDDKARANGDVF